MSSLFNTNHKKTSLYTLSSVFGRGFSPRLVARRPSLFLVAAVSLGCPAPCRHSYAEYPNHQSRHTRKRTAWDVVPGSNFLVALGRVITSPLMPIATNATDSNRGVKLFFVSCLHKTAPPTSSPSQLYVFIYLHFSSFSHTAQLGHSYRPYCHSGAKVTLYASF